MLRRAEMKGRGTVHHRSGSVFFKIMVRLLRVGFVAAFVSLLLVCSTVSVASAQGAQAGVAQHALLVSSKPAADQVLQSPPESVQMWFSEPLVPVTSKALVVNTGNRQVDMNDSHVNDNNGEEMDLTLPLLPAGTYVVVWRTQSATDGHVAGGSFLFRIARPDGSVPPIPAVLPSGHVPGGGGIGVQSGNLDGPTLLQTIATWIALLLFTFWVGGIIWETWIFPPQKLSPSDHPTAIQQASRRWRMYTPYVLVALLIANVGIIAGLAAELAGDWSGIVSIPLLHAILFQSHFGIFWWLRQVTTLLALVFSVWQILRLRRKQVPSKPVAIEENGSFVGGTYPPEEALLYGESAFIKVLADIPHLPRHLVEGLRQRFWYDDVEAGLALILVFAFALSGHAAAVTSSALWAVIGIDVLHLLADAAWVGGLLYIALMLLPTLNKQANRDWAGVLAVGLPRFSVIALTSVILLAATGSFNTTTHLTSFDQFWTTTYGRTLIVKIITFLVMIGISTYHAFFLRPRMAYALGKAKPVEEKLVSVEVTTDDPPDADNESTHDHDEQLPPVVLTLGKRLEQWLRLEATLGAGILLCVALLAAFAGSLTPPPPPNTGTLPSGPVSEAQTVDGYNIRLKISPATFGTNNFTAIIKSTQGQPTTGAGVTISTTMLDMDMGTETAQLQEDPKQPGTYNIQADLSMGGRWEIKVRILPATSDNFVTATFDFSVA